MEHKFNRERVKAAAGRIRRTAFTLIELLVVIAIIAIPGGAAAAGALPGQGGGGAAVVHKR